MDDVQLLELNFRQPSISTSTGLYKSIGRRANLVLEGRMLVLDPSCGSMSSQPGYAEYVKGELIDSGVVEMPIAASLTRRLYYLGRTLREQFGDKYDCVVVEDVPLARMERGKRGNTYMNFGRQLSLHYAVGVIKSSFDCDFFIEVHPATWHSFAPENYLKSDESDALVMGHAALQVAAHVRDRAFKPVARRRGRSSK